MCGHLFSIIGVSSDIRFDISLFIFYDSNNERKIRLLDGSFCYLELQCMHGLVIFCYDDESTGILIKSMNNPWTFYSIDDGRMLFVTSHSECCKMMKECIDKRSSSSSFPWCRMSIDSCIFVDNCKVIILIDDIEWNIFRNELHRFHFPLYFDNIAFVDFFIF